LLQRKNQTRRSLTSFCRATHYISSNVFNSTTLASSTCIVSIPRMQGDNAGPHQDGDFVRFCKNYCAENGWYWQSQAPQMPYNLDLAVFSSMSWHHNVLLQQSAANMVQPDKIWEAIGTVRHDLELCTVEKVLPLRTGCHSSHQAQMKQHISL
jgi:hypothetical protein